MVRISPSVLSCDFSHMGDDIQKIEKAGAELVHLDVMDGLFVPNISFGAPVIKCCRPCSGLIFDTHLMIREPIRYIDDFVKAGSDIITIHVEACEDVRKTLEAIRSKGVKAGITIKPATPVSAVAPYLDSVDMILIMSVEPGFGGQKFIPESLGKLREARQLIENSGRNIDLEIDGGVTTENIGSILEAGANVIVAGSAVFKAADIPAVIRTLKGEN